MSIRYPIPEGPDLPIIIKGEWHMLPIELPIEELTKVLEAVCKKIYKVDCDIYWQEDMRLFQYHILVKIQGRKTEKIGTVEGNRIIKVEPAIRLIEDWLNAREKLAAPAPEKIELIKPLRCECCGGTIKDLKCEYCGAEYKAVQEEKNAGFYSQGKWNSERMDDWTKRRFSY